MWFDLPVFIETIPNRTSPPAVLLRESYREGKRVKKRTLANLSALPEAVIDGLKGLLKGGIVVGGDGAEGGLHRDLAEISAPEQFPGVLCMLAYLVEWDLRTALAPLLFHDTDLDQAKAERSSPVVKTELSELAKAKKTSKLNREGLPVMAFSTLLDHLGTLARNTVTAPLHGDHSFTLYTKPTPIQAQAFDYLHIDPTLVQ